MRPHIGVTLTVEPTVEAPAAGWGGGPIGGFYVFVFPAKAFSACEIGVAGAEDEGFRFRVVFEGRVHIVFLLWCWFGRVSN